MSIHFKLSLNNIGPHLNLSHNQTLNSLNNAIFAVNGNGKTFISKMFRLASLGVGEPDKYISIGEQSGSFTFSVNDGQEKKLTINLSKSKQLKITDTTDYIFHTFNSDYVKENIEAKDYTPDGDIEGYILGKRQIDISKEKVSLKDTEGKIDDKKNQINKAIGSGKDKLDKIKINKSLREYKNINFQNIYSGVEFNEDDFYKNLLEQLNLLKSIPEDLPKISDFSLSFDFGVFDNIRSFLSKSFDRSAFRDEFKEKVKLKYQFIQLGMPLIKGKDCPFCEQSLQPSAVELIDLYTKFMDDSESKSIDKADSYIRMLEGYISNLDRDETRLIKVEKQFGEAKKYIPSFKDVVLKQTDSFEELIKNIKSIIEQLDYKKQDVGKSISISSSIIKIDKWLRRSAEVVKNNSELIDKLNSILSDSQNEKRELNRRICKSIYTKILLNQEENIEELKKLEEQALFIQNEIIRKESSEKISKKLKVKESLEYFLDYFFKDKYTLSEDFKLVFLGAKLGDSSAVSDVLSEGEKSIVAFCHYLAEVHLVVSKEDDYQRLYFIIDDPISSLDFHYVYCVNQIIRNLNSYFDIEGYSRFLILTHSIEFMSLLIRNRVVAKKWIIESGKIKDLSKDLIMPYESHLRDVYLASKDKEKITHTIGNSIRHVIETISRFDDPATKLEDYTNDISEFEKSEYLYSLMQDKSHGILQTENPCTPKLIQEACKSVIKFIDNKFKGQKKYLENNVG